jgi:hypothetical protein
MLEWGAIELATAAVAVVFVVVHLVVGSGYDDNGSRNSINIATIVTMAMTPIANFIMNQTSCVTKIRRPRCSIKGQG